MGKKKFSTAQCFGLAPLKPQAARRDGVDAILKTNKVEINKVNFPSPSVSLTFGEDDTEFEKSEFESHTAEMKNQNNLNAAGIVGLNDIKAP